MTVGCYRQWPPTTSNPLLGTKAQTPVCRFFAWTHCAHCTKTHIAGPSEPNAVCFRKRNTLCRLSVCVGMCDVLLIAVRITRPPEPAVPVSFQWFGQRSQYEPWMLSTNTLLSGAGECNTQQLLHIYIWDPLSLNPAWRNLPQIVSPLPAPWTLRNEWCRHQWSSTNMQLGRALHKCLICGWMWLAFPAPPSLALNCSPAWDWASRPHEDTVSLQNSLCVKSYIGNYHKYVFTYYLSHIPKWQTLFSVMKTSGKLIATTGTIKTDIRSLSHTWVCVCIVVCLFLLHVGWTKL